MDMPPVTIPFKISLTLTLEGVVLKIRNGKILEFQIGACKGSGSMSCAGVTFLDFEEKQYALPGSIDFDEGIPILDLFEEEAAWDPTVIEGMPPIERDDSAEPLNIITLPSIKA